MRCDNENCFTIKFQGQSPKCKISETSQVNEIVKNMQLYLSHSCTIVVSVCRCQGITKCKITETVVTSVSSLCNAIFEIDKPSRAWIFIWSDDSPTQWNCVVIMETVLPYNSKDWILEYTQVDQVFICVEKS